MDVYQWKTYTYCRIKVPMLLQYRRHRSFNVSPIHVLFIVGIVLAEPHSPPLIRPQPDWAFWAFWS